MNEHLRVSCSENGVLTDETTQIWESSRPDGRRGRWVRMDAGKTVAGSSCLL
jgi:hypothetical protein